MSVYPYGVANPTGVFEIWSTNFSPNDVVRAIKDNYSPVNRTSLMNSLGYQVGLVQNFVNKSYLGRPSYPVDNAYMVSGWALSGMFIALSGEYQVPDYQYTQITQDYAKSYLSRTYRQIYSELSPGQLYLSDDSEESDFGNWRVALNKSGLYFTAASYGVNPALYIYNGSGSYGSVQSVIKVTNTNSFYIGNDSSASYSGELTLRGTTLELIGRQGIYLQGLTTGHTTYVYFCGPSLVISGGANDANVQFYNNVMPTTDNEREIGDASLRWRDAYVSMTHSTFDGNVIIYDGAGSSTFANAQINITMGHLCGATPGLGNGSLHTVATNAGGVQVGAAGVYPNAIMLSKGTASGFIYITSAGQLAYYRTTGTPSGIVLTSL